MAKKKLLSEAQVRRFMGLAGLKPVSRAVIQEMGSYMEKEDDPADEEGEEHEEEGAGGDHIAGNAQCNFRYSQSEYRLEERPGEVNI